MESLDSATVLVPERLEREIKFLQKRDVILWVDAENAGVDPAAVLRTTVASTFV
jgi:hypothetical protein